MGSNTPTGSTGDLEELDRLIEGRWSLINRLFEDVEQLVDERDRLAGRSIGLLDRLFGRRQQAPAPVGTSTVRRPAARGHLPSKSSGYPSGHSRRTNRIRAVS